MAQQPNQGNQGGSQGSQTQRTTQSGSVTDSNSPGQGGGGQERIAGNNDSQFPATGSRRSVAQQSNSPSNQINQDISENFDNQMNQESQRRGQGNALNFQGNEDMGIYMAIPSYQTPGKYVEYDNLSADGAHELTGMYQKAQAFNLSAFENNVSRNEELQFNQTGQVINSATRSNPVRIGGETDKTAQYGHSGTPGKSLAPPEEDGRKTSPIRGGRLEGERELGKLASTSVDSNS